MTRHRFASLLAGSILLAAISAGQIVRGDYEPGHSHQGSAFDSGMRQRPWRMSGIGKSHFPITTKIPEVQEWFDQGNSLLHSFWFEEAERSFRWCLKLDPDCAMAYWGLARTGLNWFTDGPVDKPEFRRYLDFLKEAVRRKGAVTPREGMYIETWEAAYTCDPKDREITLIKGLQKIVLRFPDDIEAKALLGLFSIRRGNTIGTELILQQVLAKEPDHPGAHHYRIHNWDGVASEEGLDSCRRYGLVAPGIGHSNHMPGHIYSKIGMWHEAARSMDAATRVELRYMNERLALPFETWNFSHNRNYLCYIQEQLGMPEAALKGARDLLAAPRDPQRNKDDNSDAYDQGMAALVRALLKFERWDEILKPGAIPWRDLESDKNLRAYAETLAYVGQGRPVDARFRLDEWKSSVRTQSEKDKEIEARLRDRMNAAEGLLRAAEGNLVEGTRLLGDAVASEKKKRDTDKYENDPPGDPWPASRALGDVYLKHGDYQLAIDAYQRALEVERNDAFSLSGLARAQFALGDRQGAARSYGRLLYEWSHGEPSLRWRREADALGLHAEPTAETPAPERPYTLDTLAALGPVDWEPYAAPAFDAVDKEGKRVRLEDFRGRNVLLVFYLNDECVHCMEQLVSIHSHAADWIRENTVVLAVSSVSPEKNKGSQKLGDLAIPLLTDRNHENARRYASYDDFEELELHSTILIDARGRVHWKRTGGDPFVDMDFLLNALKQMNAKPGA